MSEKYRCGWVELCDFVDEAKIFVEKDPVNKQRQKDIIVGGH